MAEDDKTGAPAGWYEDADGIHAYWDGMQWLRPAGTSTGGVVDDVMGGPVTAPPSGEMAAQLAPRRSRKRLWIIGGTLLGVLVAGGVTAAALTVSAGATERDAEAACRTEIVSILKAPTTATLTEVQTLDRSAYVTGAFSDMYELFGLDPTEEERAGKLSDLADKAQVVIDQEAENGQEKWFVVGTVDSENGYGAMVRNTWTCETLFENGVKIEGPDARFDGED